MKLLAIRTYSRASLLWMSVALILFILLVLLSSLGDARRTIPETPAASNTVAIVNGSSLSRDQLYQTLVSLAGKQALEQLITETLLQQQADQLGIVVTEEDIDKDLSKIRREYNSPEEYRTKLSQDGFTESTLREQIHTQLLLRKILGPQTAVSDDQVKVYYDQNKALIASPEMIRASHILVKTRQDAEAILSQLQAGADFAVLAKEKSIDTGTKNSGGDLDYFPRGYLDTKFEEAAFALEPGQISGIVETTQGFHIIKVTDRRLGSTPTFDERKEELRNELIDAQVHNLAGPYLEKLRSEATIQLMQLQP
ncbi:peptidylprolyl isomerase [Paenibacillus hexagrammi]|uniref:peptidylprolyl isomerase n=1 Tax=Paenibacillus hexagrammi TaxID=2908839 RepID=A0ABY3SN60_9BACL|nr:peptidylprolyl isomerase [Paenibacillus sp. YPD9-1]UJF35483.1 peptidylprolyl isomerase [Paenibacillus sp. YPD9-1]